MNLDDESLLSAYLDDELDPSDRLVVEWAVESNPPLAEDLRSLALARDAVSSLGRSPVPRDLAGPVVAKLNAARRRARRRSLSRPVRWVGGALAVLSMAASLLLALVLLHRATHETPEAPLTIALDQSPEVPSTPNRTHPTSHPAPVQASPSVPVSRAIVANPPAEVRPRLARRSKPSSLPDDAHDRDVRLQVAALMDQPRMIRALIVTNVIDASDQVQTLIQQDARKNPDFGRITIYQGIVVDPDQPDEAEVFPVVLDEPGSGPFLDRLHRLFPDLVIEREVSPDFLTQLPEVGQVALFHGTKAAPLVAPPRELDQLINANRGIHQENQFDSRLIRDGEEVGEFAQVDRPSAGLVGRPGLPSVGVGVGQPATSPGKPRDPGPGRKADDAVTILVWVTRPGH